MYFPLSVTSPLFAPQSRQLLKATLVPSPHLPLHYLSGPLFRPPPPPPPPPPLSSPPPPPPPMKVEVRRDSPPPQHPLPISRSAIVSKFHPTCVSLPSCSIFLGFAPHDLLLRTLPTLPPDIPPLAMSSWNATRVPPPSFPPHEECLAPCVRQTSMPFTRRHSLGLPPVSCDPHHFVQIRRTQNALMSSPRTDSRASVRTFFSSSPAERLPPYLFPPQTEIAQFYLSPPRRQVFSWSKRVSLYPAFV